MQTEAVLAGLPLERAAKEGVFFGESGAPPVVHGPRGFLAKKTAYTASSVIWVAPLCRNRHGHLASLSREGLHWQAGAFPRPVRCSDMRANVAMEAHCKTQVSTRKKPRSPAGGTVRHAAEAPESQIMDKASVLCQVQTGEDGSGARGALGKTDRERGKEGHAVPFRNTRQWKSRCAAYPGWRMSGAQGPLAIFTLWGASQPGGPSGLAQREGRNRASLVWAGRDDGDRRRVEALRKLCGEW